MRAAGLGERILEMAPNRIVKLIIQERLDGHYGGARDALEQIEIFIAEAQDETRLQGMYWGWMPWM